MTESSTDLTIRSYRRFAKSNARLLKTECLTIQPTKNLPICLSFQQAWFLLDLSVEAAKPDKLRMKRIEAVVKRSALDDFHRCAQQLGIFGFDLSEERKLPNHQPPTISSEGNSHTASKLKVDFAVLDEEVKPTIHAVLESVHPNSIAVFKFEQDTQPPTSMKYGSPQKFKSLP